MIEYVRTRNTRRTGGRPRENTYMPMVELILVMNNNQEKKRMLCGYDVEPKKKRDVGIKDKMKDKAILRWD